MTIAAHKLKISKNYILYSYLILWFTANLLFLTDFPFVHTDEPWLSGLSRSMIETMSPAATEDFFDLYVRNPHALKILFHGLQILFIRLLGYSLFSVRILSLVSALFCLLLIHRLVEKTLTVTYKKNIALFTVFWMSMDVQFIYISHFARQEIFIILLLLIMLNIVVTVQFSSLQKGILTGTVLGLASGFHPNSFIIAWPIGLFLLLEIIQKKRKIREGMAFLLSAAFITTVFLLISIHFNPDFIHDYRSYGEPLGVLDSPDMKILKIPGFYQKLFYQIGGTYYTPGIWLQMILFPLLLLLQLIRKKGSLILCGFMGFNIGLIIIGKYSQPSISFLLPFYYLLWAGTMEIRSIRFVIPLFMSATLFFTIMETSGEKEVFGDYTDTLNEMIPPDSIALGNLYSEYAMNDGKIYDWRNLHFLRQNNINLKEYIRSRNIEYLIISEELSFIYENRPYWNVLYGNLAHWYPELLEITANDCSEVGTFPSPGYGMRIAAYRYRQPWTVTVYKVNYRESIIE